MSQIKKARPSPAMVVALLALIAAVAGTAIADPFADKSISAKKTKKIANKQITKRAGGLTVGNAKNLGGTPASAYGLKPDWVLVNAAGGIVQQSGGISVTKFSPGVYFVNFPSSLVGRPLSATLQAKNDNDGSITVVPCGGSIGDDNASPCSTNNTNNSALVHAYGAGTNNSTDRPFYLIAFKP
jgi:hypothetical protein